MHLIRRLSRFAALAAVLLVPLMAGANDIGNSSWSESDPLNNQTAPNGWTDVTMTPSQVQPTARAMMGALKRWYDHANATLTSGGSANSQTLTYAVSPAALVAGDGFTFIAGFSNTGAANLSINGLGTQNILIGSAPLVGGEIVAGRVVTVYFDGSNFQLASGAGGGGSTSPGGTDGQIQYNNSGAFGGYGVGTGLTVTGGNLTATGVAGLTNTHIFVGNVGGAATDVALSGDCTLANTGAVTCSTLNGTTPMKTDASNASLPTALTSLGLGTASSPTFGGLTVSGAVSLGATTATTEAVGGATLGTASLATKTLTVGQIVTLGNAIAGFQRQTPTATNTFDVHVKRVPAYTGGTVGNGNAALYVESNPGAGINANENGITIALDSSSVYADSGQSSPLFSQGTKESTGYGFGGKFQLNDINKTTTPTHGAVGIELALKASHPDPGVVSRAPFGTRSGLHISEGPLVSGYDGSPPGFESGIKISGDGNATIHTGLLFDGYTLSGSDDTQFVNLLGVQGNLAVLGNAIDLGSIVTSGNLIVGPGYRVGNNGVVKGAGSVAVAPGAAVVNTSQAQSGSTNLLAVASTASISVGQTVTGANIPAGDQVTSVVKELEYTSTANGVSASGQNLLAVTSFTGAAKGMQCKDVTTPGAIGAGNIVTNVTTVLPAVITLTSNLLAPTVDGDTIVCDPVVTLASATTGTNGVGVALTFGSPVAGMISYVTPNKWDAGIVVDSNAMSSSTKAVFAVQNFGTDPTDTYTSEWDANGAIKVTAATVSGATTLTGAVTASTSINSVGPLNDNGTGPTGTAGSGYVRATSPTIATPTFTGTVSATLVTGLNAPSNPTDAANKNYVDGVTSGIITHASAQAATTANLTATASGTGVGKTLTNSGAQAAFAVDSYSASVNDRILVKDQTTQKDNGIYTVTTVGTGASNWVLTRATDFDQASASEVSQGAAVIIINGTANAKTQWIETGIGPFTVDTTAIVFSQLQAASNGTVNSGTIHQFGEYSAAGTAISGIGPFTGLIDGQGAGGVAINYAGTSCTNQFPRSLNAHGAATCATVGTADLASSLSLTTPTLGVASATTINKWSFTAPATAATLTAGADGLTYTMPPTSQTIVGVTSTQNLSNKTYERWTFTAPATAATLTAGGDNLTYTGPSTSQTLVGLTSTDALLNKTVNKWTFTAPTTAATLTAGGDNLTYTMPAASKTIMASDYSNGSSLGTANSFLTSNGTGIPNAVAITGLVLGNGASAPTAYGGSGTCAASNWFTALSAAGVKTCTQPAFTDISGTITATQGGVFTGTSNAFMTGAGANVAPNFVALTGIVKGNGASAPTAVTAPSGTIVGTTDTQTLTGKTATDLINQEVHTNTAFTLTTSTTLTTIGGFDQTFTAAGHYSCNGHIHFTTLPTSSNGFKIALVTDGTSSVTALQFTADARNLAAFVASGFGTATALGSTAIAVTAAMSDVFLSASMQVNVGGVIHVQAAENASSGTIAFTADKARWDCHRAS